MGLASEHSWEELPHTTLHTWFTRQACGLPSGHMLDLRTSLQHTLTPPASLLPACNTRPPAPDLLVNPVKSSAAEISNGLMGHFTSCGHREMTGLRKRLGAVVPVVIRKFLNSQTRGLGSASPRHTPRATPSLSDEGDFDSLRVLGSGSGEVSSVRVTAGGVGRWRPLPAHTGTRDSAGTLDRRHPHVGTLPKDPGTQVFGNINTKSLRHQRRTTQRQPSLGLVLSSVKPHRPGSLL